MCTQEISNSYQTQWTPEQQVLEAANTPTAKNAQTTFHSPKAHYNSLRNGSLAVTANTHSVCNMYCILCSYNKDRGRKHIFSIYYSIKKIFK